MRNQTITHCACVLQTYLAACQYLTQYGANSLAQVGTLSLVELPYPSGALLCQPDVLQVRLEGFVTFHLGINRHSLVNAPDYLLLGCHNYKSWSHCPLELFRPLK